MGDCTSGFELLKKDVAPWAGLNVIILNYTEVNSFT